MSQRKSRACVLVIISIILCTMPVMAEDWDGIVCYAGHKANPKTCKSCVTVYTDYSILKRDCYESLSSIEVHACETSSYIKCHHCNETLCNEGHPKHKCIKCDSKSDTNCMTNATQFNLEQCIHDSNGLDDFYCFTSYNTTTGGNERGCITTITSYSMCIHNEETCKLCVANDQSNACNGNEFPENRRKCINCDTLRNTCPTQQNPELVSQYSAYCRNATDSCAIIDRGGKDNWMQMCASEMDDSTKRYCNDNQGRCEFCTGEHNCNLINSTGDPPITTTTTATTTPDPSNSTEHEIVTKQPSKGHHFYGNYILLAINFMIISILTP